IYVLPDAVNLVQKGPPVVSAVTANGDGTVTISGAGFGPDSRVFFDGMQAAGVYNPSTNAILVTPPAGAAGQISTVAVYNSDSQNSLIAQSANPPSYSYTNIGNPQIQSISPSSLNAGANGEPSVAKVDI